MAYTQFKTFFELQEKFSIIHESALWIPNNINKINTFKVSDFCLENLKLVQNMVLNTEKIRSEAVIFPLLLEIYHHNKTVISLFSGCELNIDKKQGLTGFCDFLFSAQAQQREITAPIFCLVEAKKDNIEKGLVQCGAEMIAATKLNALQNKSISTVYGCVTNAFEWQFLKLEQEKIIIDTKIHYLNFQNPQNILSILNWIVKQTIQK